MTLTVLLEGGPFHGQRHEFPAFRYPDEYQPWPPPEGGMYHRTGEQWAGCLVYEWSEA